MQKKHLIVFTLLVVVLLFMVEPVYAGPGGYIAKGLFKTWWGKLLLGIISIIFLPLIIYIQFREKIAIRKNIQDLSRLDAINKDFRWSHLEKSVRNVFVKVYTAWSEENMEAVSTLVSSWYWQNQQLVVLDEWKKNGFKNVCSLQDVVEIKALHLDITNQENLEGSRITFLISANIEDFLVDRESGGIVYGRRGYQVEDKIWTLEYTDGNWLLDDIRESNLSLAYAKLKNIIPENLPERSIRKGRAVIGEIEE